MVEQLAGLLVPERDISLLVINPATKEPISPVTLRRHFRKQLDVGFAKIRVRHHMALFKNVEAGNVTAQIWWDKTRNGIRERVGFEVPLPTPTDGKDGAPATDSPSLEVARRIAFLLSMGASMPKPVPAHKPTKPAKKAKQPA